MIQRIQTVYLFIVAALAAAAACLPMASFFADAEPFDLCAYGLRNASGDIVLRTTMMAVLLDAACLLPLATIFLYRRRMLQVRLCAVEAVLLVGSEAMMLIYYFLGERFFSQFAALHDKCLYATLALPAAGLLFCWLAARAIMRDEILVRSLDRIR